MTQRSSWQNNGALQEKEVKREIQKWMDEEGKVERDKQGKRERKKAKNQ